MTRNPNPPPGSPGVPEPKTSSPAPPPPRYTPGRTPPSFRCDGEPLDPPAPPPGPAKPLTIFDTQAGSEAMQRLIMALGSSNIRRHGIPSKMVRWEIDKVQAVTRCILAGLIDWNWTEDRLTWTPGYGTPEKLSVLFNHAPDILVAFGVVKDYDMAYNFMSQPPLDPDWEPL